MNADLFGDSGAEFSQCQQYRYRLWRKWDPTLADACFVMLNPSTADEVKNDPTVERCEVRARKLGYGGLRVANIFALRSTDPKVLYDHEDPVGPENDRAILDSVSDAGLVVCGWGRHGALKMRGKAVFRLLAASGVQGHYLRLNKDGSPGHPLYLGYSMLPKRWTIDAMSNQ